MATITLDRNQQRTCIAKMRGVANLGKLAPNGEQWAFNHERTRKTKATVENNVYSLTADGLAIVILNTNTGILTYTDGTIEALYGSKLAA